MNGPRILIRQGRVLDPANGVDALMPVYISDGRVAGLGVQPDGFEAEVTIDAEGQIVCPGFIDLSARLREPGQEQKATIASETLAASAGGVTTLCCPPDTSPVLDTPAVAQLLRERAETAGYARVLPIGALTRGLAGKELSEMCALKEAGCLAVGNAGIPVNNLLVMRRALEYAASHDLLVIVRPEDAALKNNGCAHEGAVGTRLGLPGIPSSAETVALAQTLALIEQVRGAVHFSQLSSRRAVEMIARARADGLPVTADVAAHYTDLTEDAVDGFNANAHVSPPLRSAEDREGLRRGLAEGVLQAICSDHQPHDLDAKQDAFPSTEPGIAALETLLPLTLRLVNEGALSLDEAIARLTVGPAQLLGLEAGHLGLGACADLCIFDPELAWTINAGNWKSRGLNTPYWGQTLRGAVTRTLLAGRVVFQRS